MSRQEFQDGDQIIGTYGGNEWIRKNGRWYGTTPLTDDTARWLIELDVQYLEPSEPTGPVKISKSDPVSTPVYQYNYTYKPKDS